jgi:hypothetical protein
MELLLHELQPRSLFQADKTRIFGMSPEVCHYVLAQKPSSTGEPDDSDEHGMDALSPQDAIIFAVEVENPHSISSTPIYLQEGQLKTLPATIMNTATYLPTLGQSCALFRRWELWGLNVLR